MIEKSVVINILEDIQQCLYDKNWKGKTLSTVKQYEKGLLVATDEDLKKLIEEHKKYNENTKESLELSKLINEKTRKIYNS